jgi:hypothetical protein
MEREFGAPVNPEMIAGFDSNTMENTWGSVAGAVREKLNVKQRQAYDYVMQALAMDPEERAKLGIKHLHLSGDGGTGIKLSHIYGFLFVNYF